MLARVAERSRKRHGRWPARTDRTAHGPRHRHLAFVTTARHDRLVVMRKFLEHEPIDNVNVRERSGRVQMPSRNSASV